MNNFFETFLIWFIDRYNDGEDIQNILYSGYTAETGSYYCPDCSPYFLGDIESFTNNSEDTILYDNALSGTTCCTQDKFCIENFFSADDLLDILNIGIVEISSTSQTYNTNLCYLLQTLNLNYNYTEVIDIFFEILSYGVVIFCYNNNIILLAAEKYLDFCKENDCPTVVKSGCCVNVTTNLDTYLLYFEYMLKGGGGGGGGDLDV